MPKSFGRWSVVLFVVFGLVILAAPVSNRAILAGQQSKSPQPLTVGELLSAPPSVGSVVTVQGKVRRDPFDPLGRALETRAPRGGASVIGIDARELPLDRMATVEGTVARLGDRLVLRHCRVIETLDQPQTENPEPSVQPRTPGRPMTNGDFGVSDRPRPIPGRRDEPIPVAFTFAPTGGKFTVEFPAGFVQPSQMTGGIKPKWPHSNFTEFYTHRGEDEAVLMQYYDVETQKVSSIPNACLSILVDTAIQDGRATIVQRVKMQGPSESLTYTVQREGKTAFCEARYYLVGERVYSFHYLTTNRDRKDQWVLIFRTIRF